jgi:membrane-associated PAP2 superfamily phosphatase
MGRAGLCIALVLALAFVVVFGLYPELDLTVASYFYNPVSRSFPVKDGSLAAFARDAAMWFAWALVAPSIVALLLKCVRPLKPLIVPGRTALFLVLTIVLSAGVLSNLVFKSHWGRPRPVMVTEFGGPWRFVPWYQPGGECQKNCSFFSGEGATAFWTYAPAALTPPAWRPLAYIGATLFGLATGGLRMAFGGHFLTDVLASGLVSFLVVWLAYAMIYRWPATRLTDAGIDAALTRLALPGYRRLQRLLRR